MRGFVVGAVVGGFVGCLGVVVGGLRGPLVVVIWSLDAVVRGFDVTSNDPLEVALGLGAVVMGFDGPLVVAWGLGAVVMGFGGPLVVACGLGTVVRGFCVTSRRNLLVVVAGSFGVAVV